jgi:hypothetical protein
MKPCARNRKQIVLFATRALPAEEAERLQAHFQSCPGCLSYWKEMSGVAQRLDAAAASIPEVQPSPAFHRQFVRRLEDVGQAGFLANLLATVQGSRLNSRLAHAVAILLVAGTVALLIFRSNSRDLRSGNATGNVVAAAAPSSNTDSSITLAGYHRVAESSLDALDELLGRQARSLSTAEGSSVSSRSKTDLSN